MVAKQHQKKPKKVIAMSLRKLEKPRVEDPPLAVLDDEEEDDASKVDNDEIESIQSPSGKKKNSVDTSAAVVYIGHLPNLLGEAELLKLLKQFGGSITHVRVSRSEKTGNSRGYAFVRIKEMEVAEIVVDTLSGYLLFSNKQPGLHRRLVCHIVPPDKVHPRLFVRHTSAVKVAQERKLRKQADSPVRSINDLPKVTAKLVQQERRKRQAIQKAGIDFADFPGYEKISPSPSSAQATPPTNSNENFSKELLIEEKNHKKHEVVLNATSKTSTQKKLKSLDMHPSITAQMPSSSDAKERTHLKFEKSKNPPKSLPSSPSVTASTLSDKKKRSSLGNAHNDTKQHEKEHKKSKRHSH